MWSRLMARSVSRRVSLMSMANRGSAQSVATKAQQIRLIRSSDWTMGGEFNYRFFPTQRRIAEMGVRGSERNDSSASVQTTEDLNSYNIAQQQFDTAANYVADVPEGLRNWLRGCMRLVKVEFP